jgi:hypothetical protein
MLATAFLKNRMPLERYQMAEHHQTGVNLTKARVGYMFLPSSAKDFVPDGVVSRNYRFLYRSFGRLLYGRVAV